MKLEYLFEFSDCWFYLVYDLKFTFLWVENYFRFCDLFSIWNLNWIDLSGLLISFLFDFWFFVFVFSFVWIWDSCFDCFWVSCFFLLFLIAGFFFWFVFGLCFWVLCYWFFVFTRLIAFWICVLLCLFLISFAWFYVSIWFLFSIYWLLLSGWFSIAILVANWVCCRVWVCSFAVLKKVVFLFFLFSVFFESDFFSLWDEKAKWWLNENRKETDNGSKRLSCAYDASCPSRIFKQLVRGWGTDKL